MKVDPEKLRAQLEEMIKECEQKMLATGLSAKFVDSVTGVFIPIRQGLCHANVMPVFDVEELTALTEARLREKNIKRDIFISISFPDGPVRFPFSFNVFPKIDEMYGELALLRLYRHFFGTATCEEAILYERVGRLDLFHYIDSIKDDLIKKKKDRTKGLREKNKTKQIPEEKIREIRNWFALARCDNPNAVSKQLNGQAAERFGISERSAREIGSRLGRRGRPRKQPT